MLETVKDKIASVSDIPFSEFYQSYISRIADYGMAMELKDLSKTDVLSVNKLIDKLYKEMGF